MKRLARLHSGRDLEALLNKPDTKTGKTPLEVLLKSMCWFDEGADRVLRLLERLVVTDSSRSREEARALMEEYLKLRTRAQQAAIAAAPYCHGRLATTERSPVSPDPPPIDVDWSSITPEQAAAAYQLIVRAGRAR